MEVCIDDLVKQYGKRRALDGITLRIGGGMFGLLETLKRLRRDRC